MHTKQATWSCAAAFSAACGACAYSSWSYACAARCLHALHRPASARHSRRHSLRARLALANAMRMGCAAAATGRACSVLCAGDCSLHCPCLRPLLQGCWQMPSSSAVCCAAMPDLHNASSVLCNQALSDNNKPAGASCIKEYLCMAHRSLERPVQCCWLLAVQSIELMALILSPSKVLSFSWCVRCQAMLLSEGDA